MRESEVDPAGRLLDLLCRFVGVCGGIVLVAMACMTVISVVGRSAFNSPILGDVELSQLAVAICISCFLPYTQLHKSNIIVDFFTVRASAASHAVMDGLGALLFAIAMALIAWRVYEGGISLYHSGEVSMLMSLPIWLSYMAMLPGLVLSSLVGLYQTVGHWSHINEEAA